MNNMIPLMEGVRGCMVTPPGPWTNKPIGTVLYFDH